MLGVDIRVIWLLSSIIVACISFAALRQYINKKMSSSRSSTANYISGGNPIMPSNPSAVMPTINIPLNALLHNDRRHGFEGLLEQTVIRNLLNTKATIVLELPEDTEIELFGKKWKVKAGSKIRIGTPMHRRAKAHPLDIFLERGERK